MTRALAAGPSLAALHRQVLLAAGLRLDETEVWRRRTAIAAALPRLQIAGRYSLQDNLDLALKDSVSVTSGGVVIGPRVSDLQERSDRNTFVEVRAIWSLNELLFTRDSLAVSAETRDRRREIRELLGEATRLYGERQRLLAVLEGGPEAERAIWRFRMAEVIGELDTLTRGWFSQAVADEAGEGAP